MNLVVLNARRFMPTTGQPLTGSSAERHEMHLERPPLEPRPGTVGHAARVSQRHWRVRTDEAHP